MAIPGQRPVSVNHRGYGAVISARRRLKPRHRPPVAARATDRIPDPLAQCLQPVWAATPGVHLGKAIVKGTYGLPQEQPQPARLSDVGRHKSDMCDLNGLMGRLGISDAYR